MDKVLCAIIPSAYVCEVDEQDLWMDKEEYFIDKYYFIVPLIDHPHSDRENGQEEIHYHVDTRYFGEQELSKSYQISTSYPRITKNKYRLEYFYLKKHTYRINGVTSVFAIRNSKLKHNCIHKGKCPHRGFDLTNVKPDKDGVITCPLHGLKFDKDSKKIINR